MKRLIQTALYDEQTGNEIRAIWIKSEDLTDTADKEKAKEDIIDLFRCRVRDIDQDDLSITTYFTEITIPEDLRQSIREAEIAKSRELSWYSENAEGIEAEYGREKLVENLKELDTKWRARMATLEAQVDQCKQFSTMVMKLPVLVVEQSPPLLESLLNVISAGGSPLTLGCAVGVVAGETGGAGGEMLVAYTVSGIFAIYSANALGKAAETILEGLAARANKLLAAKRRRA